MQPRFTVGILVLKAEGVVSTVRYSVFLFQTAPTSVVAKPNQIAVLVGHLSWDADLIAVEVVGLLVAFASEVVAALEHFAVGFVTVVFVAGYQSVGLVVFDHDVVAVGETAQFFVVASVNGGQIAIAVVVVAIWQRSSEKCLHCAYLTLGMEILYKIRITNF